MATNATNEAYFPNSRASKHMNQKARWTRPDSKGYDPVLCAGQVTVLAALVVSSVTLSQDGLQEPGLNSTSSVVVSKKTLSPCFLVIFCLTSPPGIESDSQVLEIDVSLSTLISVSVQWHLIFLPA